MKRQALEPERFNGMAMYYDAIYADKDYGSEVSFIEDAFRQHGSNPRHILELGCGTGNYTRALLKRGYDVTAVDVSIHMLDVARSKCNCRLIREDITKISLGDRFDGCIAMFAVMGYLTEDEDVVRALRKVREHLNPGGLFIFDVWNGLAVVHHLPEVRVKEVNGELVRLTRIAVPALNAAAHTCEVNYTLFVEDMVSSKILKFTERHIMRFFFPREIALLLKNAGFEILRICPFMELEGKVDENDWNMFVVARSR